MQFDREYDAAELKRLNGSPQQLARVTLSRLEDGREQGVRVLDFRNGSGFNFTVVPDRGMDLAFAEYRGRNLAWMSPAGIASPAHYEPAEWGWARNFFGGLMTTCGLVNVGVPSEYAGEKMGAHGRISNIPAQNMSYDHLWVGDDLYLVARGEMIESRLGIGSLRLRRSISTKSGSKNLTIRDRIENIGHQPIPHQILYHINAGFPVVGAMSSLICGSRFVTPRDAQAAEAKELFHFCQGPTPAYQEKVYYHDVAPSDDGRCWAATINPSLDGGLGLYVKWDPKNLPHMTQWKMMGEGTYVVGMEPCNSYGIGFERAKALGLLRILEPGEEVMNTLEIGVLAGAEEITAFEEQAMKNAPSAPEFGTVVV